MLELRRRYTNMYVPSDFFFTEIRWPVSFPPNATFSIQKPCAFHIMHRSVESLHEPPAEAVLEPADADYLFSAKVRITTMMMRISALCFVWGGGQSRINIKTKNWFFVHFVLHF